MMPSIRCSYPTNGWQTLQGDTQRDLLEGTIAFNIPLIPGTVFIDQRVMPDWIGQLYVKEGIPRSFNFRECSTKPVGWWERWTTR